MGFLETILKAAKNSSTLVNRKSPLILTGLGIGLGITSTVMAVKATPEANDIYTKIKQSDLPENEKRKEVIKNVVPLYLPSALTGGLAIASVVGGYKIQADRLTEMTAAYILAAKGLQDYKQTIIDKYGEIANEEIEKEVAKNNLEKAKEAKNAPDKDDDPCYKLMNNTPLLFKDTMTGQRYKTTITNIYNACLDISERLTEEEYVTVAEFYEDIYASGVNAQADSAQITGWLSGDSSLLCPRIDDKPEVDELDGKLYYNLRIDTNPLFASYLEERRRCR